MSQNLYVLKFCFAFQQDYQLDSFVQCVDHLPTVRTRDCSLHAHYIAFQKMGDQWFCFNDGVVHKVNLLQTYSINLVIYRLENTEGYNPPMDLSSIPELGKSVVLNR